MVASFSRPTIGLGYRLIQVVCVIAFINLLYGVLFVPTNPVSHPIACHRLVMSFLGIPSLAFFGVVYMAYEKENEPAPKWASYGTFTSMTWFACWLIAMFVDIFTN